MNERLTIGTPENVSFGYPIAGIGSRFVAALVDTSLIILLQLVVYTAAFLLLIIMGAVNAVADMDVAESVVSWLLAGFTLIAFLFFWGYYIFFEILWNGQSPGKRLMQLRVVRVDGGAVGLTESIIRNLIRLVDFLPASYGLGVVVMFLNVQSRRLGDMAAGTLVVHDRFIYTLDSLAQRPLADVNRYWENLPPVNLPLHLLQPDDMRLLEELLQREPTLLPRERLAEQVVQYVYNRLELPMPNLGVGQAARHLAAIVKQARENGVVND